MDVAVLEENFISKTGQSAVCWPLKTVSKITKKRFIFHYPTEKDSELRAMC
jgi:hypothetical protein